MFKKYCKDSKVAKKKLENTSKLSSFNCEINSIRLTFDFFNTDLNVQTCLIRILEDKLGYEAANNPNVVNKILGNGPILNSSVNNSSNVPFKICYGYDFQQCNSDIFNNVNRPILC